MYSLSGYGNKVILYIEDDVKVVGLLDINQIK